MILKMQIPYTKGVALQPEAFEGQTTGTEGGQRVVRYNRYYQYASDLCVRLPAWTLFLCGEEHRMTTIRVHLADDHTMFREGLEYILSSRGDGDIEVVGRSSSGGEDAIALIKKNTPDVVVTQI